MSVILWKPFFYQISVEHKSDVLLFNSFTGAVHRFSSFDFQPIASELRYVESNGHSSDIQSFTFLKDRLFIVPDFVNERDIARSLYLTNKYSHRKAILVIAPTLQCNLSCEYCFQKDLPSKSTMTQKVSDQLVEFARYHIRVHDEIGIVWFGGEPLLEMPMIENISRRLMDYCRNSNTKYVAELVTNGYLLTRTLIDKLVNIGVGSITISIDGPPNTQVRRKGSSTEKSLEFFRNLLNLIPLMLERFNRISLRVNTDWNNEGGAYFLADMLNEFSIKHPRLRIEYARTCSREAGKNGVFTLEEYAHNELKFNRYLEELGYEIPHFMHPILNPCSAVLNSFYAIDPSGYLYKCTPQIGRIEEAVGHLDPVENRSVFSRNTENSIKYSLVDPWSDSKCTDCVLMPICMGSCAKRRFEHDSYCTYHKINLSERLDLLERNLTEEKKFQLARTVMEQYRGIFYPYTQT